VLFIETPVFTREITALLPDENYRELQIALLLRPEAGDLITGSGGLRKVRWPAPGKGKRGGLRVICPIGRVAKTTLREIRSVYSGSWSRRT